MTALAMVRAGLDLATPLGEVLPEARGTSCEPIPIDLLLSHRAGLEARRDLHLPLLQGEIVNVTQALRIASQARRADAVGIPPLEGFAPVYSDLGYVLAGAALARVTGTVDAGEAIERLVLQPLGLSGRAGTIRGLAQQGVFGPFAPTEDVAWRGGRITGAVHDENAWALTGLGGSGHAGIFATADAVLTFGTSVLDALERGLGPLGDLQLAPLVRRRPGGTLRAGFDGKSAEASSAGDRLGPESFGHLGFTGTSLWIDPEAQVVVTLLTNRVCPTRDHQAIRAARPLVHDALFECARELGSHENS